MNHVIYKYPLEVTDRQDVEMPQGAKILSVQTQGEVVCLWALVDKQREIVRRKIRILGTGHEHEESYTSGYIGTTQQANGALVWHVFDEGEMTLAEIRKEEEEAEAKKIETTETQNGNV